MRPVTRSLGESCFSEVENDNLRMVCTFGKRQAGNDGGVETKRNLLRWGHAILERLMKRRKDLRAC